MSRFRWIFHKFGPISTTNEALSATIRHCTRQNIFQTKRLSTTNANSVTTTRVPEFENESIRTHDDLYKLSLDKPDLFWGTLARSRLDWFQDFGLVRDCNLGQGHIRWFLDGKLNACGKN